MKLNTLIFGMALMLILPIGVWAAPKTADDAKQLTVEWLKRDPRPLGATLGQRVKEVQTFKDAKGEPLYHVVYLDPAGFVIVPAEDLVEPVIAFASQGRFDPSTNNPLGVFVSCDVPARVARARGLRTGAPTGHFLEAQNKWKRLQSAQNANTNEPAPPNGINAVSDLRIAPLLQTTWNQGTAGATGIALYNYYTPPHAAGCASNYVCGCVATALAQLLRYFQYPTGCVGTNSQPISIDGTNTTARLRGGDGAGGPYDWSNMPAGPWNPSIPQCQAIGALTYDSAVAVDTGFGAGASSANVASPVGALLQTFMYSNAIFANVSNAADFDPLLVTMVNANLDARLPVCVALNGHQVDCDGYGYSLSTLYNHLNMGWGSEGDAWYALPTVTTDITNLWGFVYNIYTNGSGEIISGRVMAGNVSLPNALVTAIRTGRGTYTATTDTNGIYSLVAVPSASQYTVTVTDANFISASTNVSTGTSWNFNICSGNVWGADFTLIPVICPTPLILLDPRNQLVNDAYPPATFAITALSYCSPNYQWQSQVATNAVWIFLNDGPWYSGSQSSTLLVNVLNNGINGNLYRCVVTNSAGSVTSSVASLFVIGRSSNCAMSAPAGLISWWTGDATANDLVGTNNGVLENGTAYAPGKVGYAFTFNGSNQCVAIPSIPAANELLSVTAWVYPTAYTQLGYAGVSGGTIIDENEGGGYSGWNLGITSSGLIWFWPSPNNDRFSKASIPLNTWTFISVNYDGTNTYFYINGALDSSYATPTPLGSPALFKIGSKSWIAGYWSGVLDEIQIYNRAISASEIQAIYHAGTNGMCAPTPLMFTGSPSYNKTNGVVLNASLRSSQSYHIQANTNLASTNWITLTNFIAGVAPIFHYTNKPPTNTPRQFYRIVSP